MSIKIHHGANGSFKTAGAVQDDLIPAVQEGRVIITNIRGVSLARLQEHLPEVPDSVQVISLDLQSSEDLERMRSWFTWAPRGAFLIFDEAQTLFPKSWREKDLEKYDFPGGPDAAKQADRPTDWLDAWTRHRHWNWDVVLTTPNIRYIREDIRNTSEMAYRHANLGVLGINGRYKEAMHDAQENKPPADGSSIVQIKKINQRTFKLYDSTATGTVTDTKAGKSIFKSPKILFLLVLLAGIFYSLANSSRPAALGGDSLGAAAQADPEPVVLDSSLVGQGASPTGTATAVRVDDRKPADQLKHPLEPYSIVVRAAIQPDPAFRDHRREVLLLEVTDESGRSFRQNDRDIILLGYSFTIVNPCAVELSYRGGSRWMVFCPGTVPSDSPQQHLPVAVAQSEPTVVTVVPDGEYASRPWR